MLFQAYSLKFLCQLESQFDHLAIKASKAIAIMKQDRDYDYKNI